ncbi:MAG: tryptophan--tRNA ligase [bacterium]|nr:tryptophan--tRNA ligase [bacterium]
MAIPTKKRVFSAAQPTGDPHIGNYLGALKQWVALQAAGNKVFAMIADLHAITAPYEARALPEMMVQTAAVLLAVGIDPNKTTIFVQSHVSAHAEAAWLLTTITPYGELTRMTQFKEKGVKQKAVGAGLFAYPILMAADILLYQTELVPVGEDQLQHLEFSRTLARKFNQQFGQTVTEPKAFLLKETARVMSLADPTRKMSKSDPPASTLALLDSPDAIRKKLRSAVTDSGTAVNPERLGPALTNLLTLYAAFADTTIQAVAEQFAGKGYAVFKDALADLLAEKLGPIRTRATDFLKDPKALYATLARGAEKAAPIAYGTLAKMKEHMGLTPS